jgi:sigma-B regulation protein RsbU (phosphoserine phosphatase)
VAGFAAEFSPGARANRTFFSPRRTSARGSDQLVLSPAVKIAEMVAMQLESGEFDTAEKVERFLRQVVQHNHDIYGSCIAFRTEQLSTPAKRYYAPLLLLDGWRTAVCPARQSRLRLFQMGMVSRSSNERTRTLVEPYFDEGGGNAIMTTYSVPFRRDGKVWGIATVDISISQLMAQAGRIDAGKGSYAFMVSKQGRFLTHPDKTRSCAAPCRRRTRNLAG